MSKKISKLTIAYGAVGLWCFFAIEQRRKTNHSFQFWQKWMQEVHTKKLTYFEDYYKEFVSKGTEQGKILDATRKAYQNELWGFIGGGITGLTMGHLIPPFGNVKLPLPFNLSVRFAMSGILAAAG